MPAIIATLLQGLLWLFKSRLGLMIAGAIGWMGISFASYNIVIEPAIDQLESYMTSGGGGTLGAAALQYMGLMGFDVCVSMLISAVLMIKAMNTGRMFLKRAAGA